MLDVYFAARYLQLRDKVQDDYQDRSTPATLRQLRTAGSLNDADFDTLDEGYALLRSADHQLRLTVGRSGRLPAPELPAFRDIARRLGYDTAAQFMKELKAHMKGVRGAYERIMHAEGEPDGN
jgi:glutamine synthetase adenylyltransferase